MNGCGRVAVGAVVEATASMGFLSPASAGLTEVTRGRFSVPPRRVDFGHARPRVTGTVATGERKGTTQ